jgi:hypothetical protein
MPKHSVWAATERGGEFGFCQAFRYSARYTLALIRFGQVNTLQLMNSKPDSPLGWDFLESILSGDFAGVQYDKLHD